MSLPSLELRRLYLDLMFCYKVVFGLVRILRAALYAITGPIARSCVLDTAD